jgi:hypothetical protein
MLDDPAYIAWQSGHRLDLNNPEEWWAVWHRMLGELIARGVEVRRARIISEPVSKYIKFEHDVTDVVNIAGGEQVRWLPRRQASDLALPGNDFWLFDDTVVLINHFNGDGGWAPEPEERNDNPTVAKLCSSAFEAVWERAEPHQRYRLV